MSPAPQFAGATPYRKLVARTDRLRRLLGLPSQQGASLETPAPSAVLEEEVRLIEQAREEWRAQEQGGEGALEAWMDWNERQDLENGVSGTAYPSRERALRNSPEGAGPVCRVTVHALEPQA